VRNRKIGWIWPVPAAAALATLVGCAADGFNVAWDACIASFERQPVNHWENSEIVDTVPAERSCEAFLEDLGRDDFVGNFSVSEWVELKEQNRRLTDVYEDSQLRED
jgi:hypothetical protein